MFWNKKDMVSVSELNEANERADFWRQKASEAATMWAKTAFELDALKASRARSNENLKLGSAASAKARRKKVVGVDWSKPIEAYHSDGRVVSVDLDYGPDNDGDYKISETMEDEIPGVGSICATYYTAGGMPSPNVSAEASRWRIRNVA
jgi:hypothetical protein